MCCVRTIHGGAGYSYYARRIQYSYYASSTVFESVVSKTKSKHSHVYESYKNSKTVTHYSYILDAANLLRGYLVIMFSRRKRKRKKLRFLMGHKHCSWRACINSFLHLPVFGLMWTGIPFFGNIPKTNIATRLAYEFDMFIILYGITFFIVWGSSIRFLSDNFVYIFCFYLLSSWTYLPLQRIGACTAVTTN